MSDAAAVVTVDEINKVMLLVQALRQGDPGGQLTLISYALVTMARAYDYDIDTVLANIEHADEAVADDEIEGGEEMKLQ